MFYLVLSICLINIVLWLVFLIRFKNLFSTDDIITRTRDQLNRMIKDIDSAADRDVFLSSEATKRIEAAVADAERKMELFTEATIRLRDMIAEADRINKLSNQNASLFQDFSKVAASLTNQKKKAPNPYAKKTQKPKIDPDAAYGISKQDDLFTSSEAVEEAVTLNIGNQNTMITEDGAAFREVPVITAKVLDEHPADFISSNTPVQQPLMTREEKRNLITSRVQKLYNEGFSIEEIAKELSCSITEVQFIIDMYN